LIEFDISAVTLDAMQQRAEELRPSIVRTPVAPLTSALISQVLGDGIIHLKLECFQHTGTFKARGALSVAQAIPSENKARGITAASAGNHAIAAAWAARQCGLSAKVVMQSTANPFRVALARAESAEVIMKDGGLATFGEAERLQREEGRTFIHPFEGLNTSLGTAGIGLEFLEDIPDLEAVIVAVGGGGLISGIAAAVKAINPDCKVYGVEPAGADSMSRSIAARRPVSLNRVDTIADSLAPPMALPLGHALCSAYVDDMVTVTDDEICSGMVILQQEAKLAVEPAVGAVMAGIMLPLRNRLKGKRVGLVVCGANIDVVSYSKFLERGRANISRLIDHA
ncbi:MAG: threonine/serine dehydratase, partial [Planktomarina sp.]|nr:threonine/serine dehydratase [Planktomarina sp.]MDS9951313.1 threonine/serine dehydratase [Planktomarina sp.]|tara:strand:- start:3324 stop:4343 length:1020 start_codon:yes stop_codon:yes gene_type:complete